MFLTGAGHARLAGLEKDLHLKGYDYNKILSVFYISYILFEIPSNMACKWIGPGWYIPSLSLGFGICSVCTAFVGNIHTASAVRFLLGMFEAGMMVCFILPLILPYFWRPVSEPWLESLVSSSGP